MEPWAESFLDIVPQGASHASHIQNPRAFGVDTSIPIPWWWRSWKATSSSSCLFLPAALAMERPHFQEPFVGLPVSGWKVCVFRWWWKFGSTTCCCGKRSVWAVWKRLYGALAYSSFSRFLQIIDQPCLWLRWHFLMDLSTRSMLPSVVLKEIGHGRDPLAFACMLAFVCSFCDLWCIGNCTCIFTDQGKCHRLTTGFTSTRVCQYCQAQVGTSIVEQNLWCYSDGSGLVVHQFGCHVAQTSSRRLALQSGCSSPDPQCGWLGANWCSSRSNAHVASWGWARYLWVNNCALSLVIVSCVDFGQMCCVWIVFCLWCMVWGTAWGLVGLLLALVWGEWHWYPTVKCLRCISCMEATEARLHLSTYDFPGLPCVVLTCAVALREKQTCSIVEFDLQKTFKAASWLCHVWKEVALWSCCDSVKVYLSLLDT